MSPKPFLENSTPDPTPKDDLEFCPDCQQFAWRDLGHDCPARAFMRWRPIRNAIICSVVIFGLLAATGLVYVHTAKGAERATPRLSTRPGSTRLPGRGPLDEPKRTKHATPAEAGADVERQQAVTQVQPIARPAGLLQAREQCPDTSSITECRAALRRALASIEWQRHARLHQGAYGVQHALRLAAALYGVPLSELRGVGMCESHLTPTSKNRTSTAAGVFQFLDSTWARAGIPGFSVYDPYANILAAARLVKTDGSWREWSCGYAA